MKQEIFSGNNSIKKVFIGFLILLIGLGGGNAIFSYAYWYFNLSEKIPKELMPSIYLLLIIAAMLLSNSYLLFSLRMFPKIINKSFKESLITGLSGIALLWISMLILTLAFFRGKSNDIFIQTLTKLPAPYFYISIMLVTVVSPLFEEVLMRGFFFELLRRKWNIGISLCVTLLFATIIHYKLGIEVIPIIIFNIIFTFLYVEGGLLSSILGHMFVNYYVSYVIN